MPQDLFSVMNQPISALGEISVAFKCEPETPLKAAIKTLKAAKIGCLVVAKDSKVLGILTERDLMNKVMGKKLSDTAMVSSFMTEDPAIVTRKTKIADAMRLMITHQFRHLIVAEPHSTVVQIISMRDICQYLLAVLDDQTTSPLWNDKDVA